MALLIVAPNRDTQAVQEHLRKQDPTLDIRIWPEIGDPNDIDFAVVWKHPPELLIQLPALKAISSYGAGVESILNDPLLPADLPVGRISGPRLAADMAEFVTAVIINQHRGLWGFYEDQKAQRWQPWAPVGTPRVGLLGSGNMGAACARVLLSLGYEVHCWNRSGSGELDLTYHRGEAGLQQMASICDFLVCLLPLTEHTQGILNADLFAQMKAGSYLINVGRGDHLVEADLINALDQQQLSGAYLDVFQHEPLPADHPFWSHPGVLMSPHCASFTLPEEAARLIYQSYCHVQQGKGPLDAINRQQGY